MKVILLDNVKKLGRRFDIVNVKDGFAQNFLIPQKKAVMATADAEKQAADLKVQRGAAALAQDAEINEIIDALNGKELLITAKANEQGGLYGAIDSAAIADEIKTQHNLELNEMFITLAETSIKEVGEHEAVLKHNEAEGKITVKVAAEE